MKRQWLPTRKGTELFPNIIQAPTKLVLRGVPEGPERDAVLRRYGGRLQSFHAKQQQNYSLSTVRRHRAHIEFDDSARATYVNQDGHETLLLEVDIPHPEQVELNPRRLPDWALLEFDLPYVDGVLSTQMYARARGSDKQTMQTHTGIGIGYEHFRPLDGVGFAGSVSDKASGDAPRADPDSSTLSMSLLVDLRPFKSDPHAGGAVVDVYATAAQVGPEELVGWTSTYDNADDVLQFTWWSDIFFGGYAAIKAGHQAQWDAAGLPRSQESLFINGNEILVPADVSALNFRNVGSPRPIYTIGSPNFLSTPGWDGWRYVEYTVDPVSQLLTSYAMTNLFWNDSLTTIVAIQDLITRNFIIHEVTDTPAIPYRGPGTVAGMVIFGDAPWLWSEWDPTTSISAKNFKWQIGGGLPLELPLLQRDVLWPNVNGLLPTHLADEPDSTMLLGTIICDLETASIAFNLTSG